MLENKDQSEENQDQSQERRGASGLLQSTLAALFGIQSEKNRQADFKTGRFSDYVFAGIIATGLLLAGMAFLVSMILEN